MLEAHLQHLTLPRLMEEQDRIAARVAMVMPAPGVQQGLALTEVTGPQAMQALRDLATQHPVEISSLSQAATAKIPMAINFRPRKT